ncbi:uncharacterized protein LOC111247990 isoform X2 [Varroa destructor]|uniref:Uncharacterized protein n=1 Tax=Varroa destructor TaxID=109461 RepID=A0A7M7JQ10_VARDE|nr:uncharacterized protein LOC111247990 isoform X2 [Varroa destructor]
MAKGKAYHKVLVPFKPSEPDNNSFQLREKSSDDCVLLDDCGPSETSSQVQYRLSMGDKEISQVFSEWFLKAIKHDDNEIESQVVVGCSENKPKAEEVAPYDIYTKEDIEYLNDYFEELQRQKEETITALIDSAERRKIISASGSPSSDTSHETRATDTKIGQDLTIKEPKIRMISEVAKTTPDLRGPAIEQIYIVNKQGIPMLQFAVQVELVESAHSVICTVPAARAAVESAKASTFSYTDLLCLDCDVIKCTRHKCNKPELRVINLLSVQPGRLVLVASPKGELIRGIIEVVHGYQKGVVGVGVGYVDEPGGSTYFLQRHHELRQEQSGFSAFQHAVTSRQRSIISLLSFEYMVN